MATKSMQYDHPAYTAVLPVGLGVNAAGANSIGSGRFTAFTQTLVKSITIAVVTAGTSTANHVMSALVYRGGTATDTQALATMGSSGFVNVTSTLTLTQGDTLAVRGGTDATMVWQAGAEMVIVPGATVTV